MAYHPIALETVIGDPRVQAFMHPEESGRFPLQVTLPEGAEPERFAAIDLGVPSVFLNPATAPDPARAHLIVSTLELAETGGSIEFSLPIEGLFGSAEVSLENGGWIVSSLHLVER